MYWSNGDFIPPRHQTPAKLMGRARRALLWPLSFIVLSACSTPPVSSSVTTPDASPIALHAPIITPSQSLSLSPATQPLQVTESQDLWQRMRGGFELSDAVDNPLMEQEIQRQVQWFAKNRRHVTLSAQRAAPYLYFVVEEAERRELPLELVLLPIIESAFNPMAGKSSGPAGLWQVVPGTAKVLGLKHNAWYDGRRDVVASTQAAMDYLATLNAHYKGDWLLTLAAYNRGQGTVDRAIDQNRARGKPTDFWSLRLPSITREYVPKLIALSRVIEQPQRHGVTLPNIDNEPYFAAVDVEGVMPLTDLARLARIDLAELQKLNPGLKRDVIHPGAKDHVLVPTENADLLSSALIDYQPSASVLREAMASSSKAAAPAKGAASSIYTVRSGDTLWKIAKRHGVSSQQLASWNGLDTKRSLRVGQRLAVAPNTPTTSVEAMEYRVQKGDSLARIAARFNVSVDDIVRWNTSVSPKTLRAGQELTLWVSRNER